MKKGVSGPSCRRACVYSILSCGGVSGSAAVGGEEGEEDLKPELERDFKASLRRWESFERSCSSGSAGVASSIELKREVLGPGGTGNGDLSGCLPVEKGLRLRLPGWLTSGEKGFGSMDVDIDVLV